MSDGLHFVFVLLGVVLTFCASVGSVTVARQGRSTILTVCLLAFFCCWCCVDTKSRHNKGFQRIFHAAVLVVTHNTLFCQAANTVNPAQRCFPLPPCILVSTPQMSFFMISGRATPCFLTRKNKRHVFFPMISGSAFPCIVTREKGFSDDLTMGTTM